MNFKMYWRKYCPTAGREQARKMWNCYEDVAEASTDFNIPRDELTIEDLNRAREVLMKTNTPMTNVVVSGWTSSLSSPANFFVDCTAATAPCQMAECKLDYKSPKKPGNNPMYVDNDKHIESSKINYLQDRLSNSFYNKEQSLPAAFNLDTPKVPDTAEKLVEAITSGNYTIKPKAERNIYDRVTNQIVWRSPSVVPDQAGYDAARDALLDLRQTAKDTIAVGTPADALLAIKAIDAFTPTPAETTTTA